MDESGKNTESPSTLDYTTLRTANAFQRWLLRPLSWWVVLLVGLLLTAPFLSLSFNVSNLLFRPLGVIVQVFLTGLFLLVFCVSRFSLRLAAQRNFQQPDRSDTFRYAVLIGLPVIACLLHQSGLATTTVFWIYSNQFIAARDSVGWKLNPGEGVAYAPGCIGPFAVESIMRSEDGDSIGFYAGNYAAGGGFVFSKRGNLYDPMFYPPDDHGPMGGGWHWTTKD